MNTTRRSSSAPTARAGGHPVDHIVATKSLPDKQKAAILGGNAARLPGINS